MNLFAFLCFIISTTCTLLFSVLRLKKAACASRIVFAPSLLFCFLCMNMDAAEPWLVGALMVEVIYNVLACSSAPSPCRQLTFAVAVVMSSVAFFKEGVWGFVAPHINFVFILIFFTALLVVYLWVYPWLERDETVSTCMLLLFNGFYASLGGIGIFKGFTVGSVLIALGVVLNFFYYVLKLFLTRRYEETRFGDFELMSLYIASRTMLVFGFQLSL